MLLIRLTTMTSVIDDRKAKWCIFKVMCNRMLQKCLICVHLCKSEVHSATLRTREITHNKVHATWLISYHKLLLLDVVSDMMIYDMAWEPIKPIGRCHVTLNSMVYSNIIIQLSFDFLCHLTPLVGESISTDTRHQEKGICY